MDPAILAQALLLPENDRIELVEQLLQSFGPEFDEVDTETYQAEIQRRSVEVDEGTAALTPWTELKSESW